MHSFVAFADAETVGEETMSLEERVLTIVILVAVTFSSRAIPFLLFSPGKPTPSYIKYLGRVLPLAVFGMLVVYCLKDVEWMRGTHGIPELIGIGVTALIQIGSRQMILSTAGGTLFYMLLIHSLQ